MRSFILVFVLLLSGCSSLMGANPDAKVMMVGDSVLSWNRNIRQSVGDALALELDQRVANFAVSASRITQPNPLLQFTDLQIPNQPDRRSADWIILNGGANDLYFECLCLKCLTTVDQLVNMDATGGEIPDLMQEMRKSGAQVMYMGYHRSGGLGSAYDRCTNELDVVEARMKAFTDQQDGMYYVDMKSVFPPRDKAFYDIDNIHPSVQGSAAMAKRLANALRGAGLR